MDLKEQDALGGDAAQHWYYRAKAPALDRVVGPTPGPVLDIGAGAGFFARHLLQRGSPSAVCVDPGYDSDRDEVVNGRPLSFRRAPYAGPVSLILMMDVLEHVDDDVGLARSVIAAAAAAGTRVVVTVPAFQWMWSGHDVFLEHRRRYTLSGVQRVLAAAGLHTEGGRYLYGSVLPLAVATRVLARLVRQALGRPIPPASQMRPASPKANTILSATCVAEAMLPGNPVARLTAMTWAKCPDRPRAVGTKRP